MTTSGTGPPGTAPPVAAGGVRPLGLRAEVADAVRAAALGTPGVTDLHTGSFGEVATYLPGRKVEGVRVRGDVVEVHVVTAWEAPVLQVADDLRRAVRAVPGVGDADIRIVVQDVAAPDGGLAAAFLPAAPAAAGGQPAPDQPRRNPGRQRR